MRISDWVQTCALPISMHRLTPVAEPTCLAHAGADRYQRPLWLLPKAAAAWQAMRNAARAQGVALDAISGFRSHAYQMGIFRRKLARGVSVSDILAVNAAPGFSEHHGRSVEHTSELQSLMRISYALFC